MGHCYATLFSFLLTCKAYLISFLASLTPGISFPSAQAHPICLLSFLSSDAHDKLVTRHECQIHQFLNFIFLIVAVDYKHYFMDLFSFFSSHANCCITKCQTLSFTRLILSCFFFWFSKYWGMLFWLKIPLMS